MKKIGPWSWCDTGHSWTGFHSVHPWRALVAKVHPAVRHELNIPFWGELKLGFVAWNFQLLLSWIIFGIILMCQCKDELLKEIRSADEIHLVCEGAQECQRRWCYVQLAQDSQSLSRTLWSLGEQHGRLQFQLFDLCKTFGCHWRKIEFQWLCLQLVTSSSWALRICSWQLFHTLQITVQYQKFFRGLLSPSRNGQNSLFLWGLVWKEWCNFPHLS